jgi:Protein phosphatase 2C
MAGPAPAWEVTAASVRGPDHARERRPRQDACAWRAEGNRLVAAIADGAGSAPMSREGARVCSATVVDALSRLPSLPPGGDEEEEAVRAAVEAAIADARSCLECRPGGSGTGSLRDYTATVVGVWAQGERGWLFHIGDGAAAAARAEDPADSVVSPPENGRFAEETFFFTDRAWRKHLRITPFSARNLVVLTSDGAGSFTFAPRWRGLDAEFVGPLVRHLEDRSPAAARRTLARVLRAPGAQAISGDDKTLIVARRRTVG